MPALLPMLLATSHIVLAADTVPKLNYEPSCRAAVTSGSIAGRDIDACKRDEETARAKLVEIWGQFTATQRAHCIQLTSLGGSPSYVEVLTCLEMARDSATMPDDGSSMRGIGR